MPDGEDIGVAVLDVDTGLFDSVTLETAPNDQWVGLPALHADGSMVARVSTTWPKEAIAHHIRRIRVVP